MNWRMKRRDAETRTASLSVHACHQTDPRWPAIRTNNDVFIDDKMDSVATFMLYGEVGTRAGVKRLTQTMTLVCVGASWARLTARYPINTYEGTVLHDPEHLMDLVVRLYRDRHVDTTSLLWTR